MDKIETFHFMEKIKAYYQNFIIADYVVNEWADKLKPYDINDVYMKFDEHLQGEYRNEIPKLHFITKFLKPASEKGIQKDYYCLCPKCQSKININNYANHVGRHNSVNYIKKNAYRLNLDINEKYLLELGQQDFDDFYDNLIEKLVDVVEDEYEKQRLKNIIFLKYGMPIETINFSEQLNFLGGRDDKNKIKT